MKYRYKMLVAAFCAAALMTPMVQAATKAKKVSVLFVLSAKSGMVSKAKSGYTLTLKGVDPQVLWFTDRPVRKAGYMPTNKYIGNWKKMFGNDSPNAAIAHADLAYNSGKSDQPRVLDLQNAKMVRGNVQFQIKSYGKAFTATKMKKVRLFIDDFLYVWSEPSS